jgi:hydroxymethylbilane synthase
MESGLCDGLILAYAGAHRMGYDDLIKHRLSLDEFTPAVGQGSVAIEASLSLDADTREKIKSAVHHEETGYRLAAERSYLKELEGGCSIPVFALAEYSNGKLSIKGGIVSLDGVERIVQAVEGETSHAESLGRQLAEKVFSAGGDRILKDIKTSLNKII